MKIPVQAPDFYTLFTKIVTKDDSGDTIAALLSHEKPVDEQDRYLHWDKLRHLTPPEGLDSEQWWFGIKVARRALYKALPFLSKNAQPFKFAQPDRVLRSLHQLDRLASGNIRSKDAIINNQTRDTYLVHSLVEEAISSSQLEGASTTYDVAREMIRQNRAPADISERMIVNNYRAVSLIREYRNTELTTSILLELHRTLTSGTLDDDKVGRFRNNSDEIHVVDHGSQEYLHTPPDADELPSRLQALCDFANKDVNDGNSSFLHPAIKAIVLHFMIGYDHPFCDGNGRVARALFYWAMAKQDYWLVEFVSISRIIKKAPAQYSRAFLETETDDNDLTYFVIHQLDVLHKAIDGLHEFLDRKMQDIQQANSLLKRNPRLANKLNFRQLSLLRHALKHPRFSYVIQEHQNSHGISYDVARNDLLELSNKFGLLDKTKIGKKYYFLSPTNLDARISAT